MRLAIGDIHGREYWKHYLNEDFTEFYFLGDYFDSFDVPFEKQYSNFIGICAAVRADSRLKLCIGNHDYHYMRGVLNERYSGYQDRHHSMIGEILEANMDLLKVLYITDDNFILSHAGLSKTFMKRMKRFDVKVPEDLNGAFLRDRNLFNFDGINNYGDDVTQGPLWIRPNSLYRDAIAGYSQIVGHTELEAIREIEIDEKKKCSVKLIFIDTGDRDTIYRF
jgi:hypothetical protein